MEKGFCLGMVLGLTIGALVVANCKKARNMITEGQNKILDKLNCEKSGENA
ncbi:MAG: hypothetical protein ACI4M6_00440 [Christensenellaceae bacterium]